MPISFLCVIELSADKRIVKIWEELHFFVNEGVTKEGGRGDETPLHTMHIFVKTILHTIT